MKVRVPVFELQVVLMVALSGFAFTSSPKAQHERVAQNRYAERPEVEAPREVFQNPRRPWR